MKTTLTATQRPDHGLEINEGYPQLELAVAYQVAMATQSEALFTTDAAGLFDLFLQNLPPARRQHYTCNCCRRFFDNYGGLVTIASTGHAYPAIWDMRGEQIPSFFAKAIDAVCSRVMKSKVTGVFYSSEQTWGSSKTGDWSHLCGTSQKVHNNPLKTAFQLMAEKKEEYGMLNRGLAEFPKAAVEQAVRILNAAAVERGEKAQENATWLLNLHNRIGVYKERTRRDNLVWAAVAMAPPGYCHIRTTMIATLLDDIVANFPIDVIKKKWAEKMHPLQYARPTAELSTGQINEAEKVIAKLESEGALARRFATLEDLTAFWKPNPIVELKPSNEGGVFANLKAKAVDAKPKVNPIELPTQEMTWEKFNRTVMPNALEIQLKAPHTGPYTSMTTSVNPDAPPILQWDNPVSWYFYYGGSSAQTFNLPSGAWVPVNAMTYAPPHWSNPEKFRHHNPMVFFILEGAKDTRYRKGGNWFPETLRSEYHAIRKVMERYSVESIVAGLDSGTASGLAFTKGQEWNVELKVTSESGVALYKLDRWD